VAELASSCDEKGLGLFLYYSYGADWKHPYFYARESGWAHARPDYENPQPEYQFRDDEDFKHYIDFVHAQLREILTQYPNIAGIWLDPIMGYYSRPDLFSHQRDLRTHQITKSTRTNFIQAGCQWR
jgi:alpha-L-fucosidase